MHDDRLSESVPEGESLRYVDDLRTGGAVGFTDERLLVVRTDGDARSVELASVESVEFRDLDWFEAVLGVALVGFGLASASRSPPLGGLFAAAGVASLYLTYRKRWRASVSVHSRPKPLSLFPADGRAFYDAFERALDDYRERVETGGRRGRDGD